MNRFEQFISDNAGFVELANEREAAYAMIDIEENDGRCVCTAGKGPLCPCHQARQVVEGERQECSCGVFVGAGE